MKTVDYVVLYAMAAFCGVCEAMILNVIHYIVTAQYMNWSFLLVFGGLIMALDYIIFLMVYNQRFFRI